MADRKIEDYQDMIDLPHHVSESRPHMPLSDRAAQFSPFAALTGYDAAVRETARMTDPRLELDEDEKQKIAQRLTLLQACLSSAPAVEITYFVPDEKKVGGAYRTVTGVVKKLEEAQRVITMTDGTKIPLDEITDLSGALFCSAEDPLA